MTTSRYRCAASNISATRTGALTLYDPATETYTPALLRTGQPAGHPNDAFDTAAIIHLVNYQQ
jgi:hypothetical protein